MPVDTGKKFGSYDVFEAIGSGGTDAVYRATDTRLWPDGVVKTLDFGNAKAPDDQGHMSSRTPGLLTAGSVD